MQDLVTLYLSIIDSIDNYTEEPMTEKEIKELEEFNKKINKIENRKYENYKFRKS